VNVRIVGVGRVGVCMLCVGDNEERERGVGAGVNATMLSESPLSIVGAAEAAKGVSVPKKTRVVCTVPTV